MIQRIIRRTAPPTPAPTQAPARRIGRVSVAANSGQARAAMAEATEKVDRLARKLAEDQIKTRLQLIATKMGTITLATNEIKVAKDEIEKLMRKHTINDFSDGRLEASIKTKYSNEKKEIDPLKLFNLKGMNRTNFFSMVKVQIGEVGKFLSENEIRAIAQITPPKVTGEELVISEVKSVVTTKKMKV